MRKNDKKVFNKPSLLAQMINLRLSGFSLVSLSTIFNCDPMAIWHRLKRNQIKDPPIVYDLGRIGRDAKPKQTPLSFRIQGDERINLGRNYADY